MCVVCHTAEAPERPGHFLTRSARARSRQYVLVPRAPRVPPLPAPMDGGLRRQVRPHVGRGIARARALLVTGFVAVGLAGCGGSPGTTSQATSPPIPAATARTANCLLWNASTPSDRRRLVAGLRAFFSQRLDTGARERLPSDDRAYAAITRYCRLPLARAFLIYRLYGNLAAFAGQR